MLTDCINDALSYGIFPDSLKFANITSVYKKGEVTDKQNYRPVSVLPLLSRVFEKVIYDQLSQHLDKHLNSLFIMQFSESSFLTTCSVQTITSMARRIK